MSVSLYYRYESFNSNLRAQNIYGNKQAPSKDICQSFATMQYLHHVMSGGYYTDTTTKLVVHIHLMATTVYHDSCGEGLKELYSSIEVQKFVNSSSSMDVLSHKAIYTPGCLRKVLYINKLSTSLKYIQ